MRVGDGGVQLLPVMSPGPVARQVHDTRRAERARRAATLISWARMVALAWNAVARPHGIDRVDPGDHSRRGAPPPSPPRSPRPAGRCAHEPRPGGAQHLYREGRRGKGVVTLQQVDPDRPSIAANRRPWSSAGGHEPGVRFDGQMRLEPALAAAHRLVRMARIGVHHADHPISCHPPADLPAPAAAVRVGCGSTSSPPTNASHATAPASFRRKLLLGKLFQQPQRVPDQGVDERGAALRVIPGDPRLAGSS